MGAEEEGEFDEEEGSTTWSRRRPNGRRSLHDSSSVSAELSMPEAAALQASRFRGGDGWSTFFVDNFLCVRTWRVLLFQLLHRTIEAVGNAVSKRVPGQLAWSVAEP